ncbi:MAG TPA: peptide ABC transporter substrate-binding protein [Candidatus Limnocylindrales bacterium]|nr:peptide ABC transporter substrate-binding protein [Candidatus Limnocylindrales bacterium]
MATVLTSHPRRGPTVRRRDILLLAVATLLSAMALAAGWPGGPTRPAGAAGPDEVRILSGAPATLDPAAQGDIGSAAVSAQLFESVTAIDPSLTVRPALAGSWDVEDGGRRIVFHLRDALAFSDGSALGAADVVRSWLRVIDPDRPSPLASLMLDVEGAAERLAGTVGEDGVALRATGNDVEVRLIRPAADFVSIVAGPTFAVVPRDYDGDAPVDPDTFVGSGAYVVSAETPTDLTLTANDRYWAGAPPIRTVRLVGDIGGRSSVAAFEDDDLDYAGISSSDASWIRFDATLGPQLREVPSMSTEYLGFDTSRPPFADVRVRQAFARAVDWRRVVELATIEATPANSMVPPGIPGRSDADFLPSHDPDAARALLAEAGYPNGTGFPVVTFLTGGSAYASGMIADVERVLGIDVRVETMDFDAYFDRLVADPPAIWSLGWVADYPGRNDFLGVLLRSGQSNNYGRWSNPEFDAAIAEAGAATDPDAANAAYDRAEAIVQREAPIVPLAYGPGWALSRDGLLGAGQNGLGILRMAGLAWVDQ